MARRVAALVLTIVVTASPVAMALCEAACAVRETQPSAAHHSCHQAIGSQPGAAMLAVHVCGHDGGLPTTLERVSLAINMPGLVSAVAIVEPPAPSVHRRVAVVDSGPPTLLNLTTPLRI